MSLEDDINLSELYLKINKGKVLEVNMFDNKDKGNASSVYLIAKPDGEYMVLCLRFFKGTVIDAPVSDDFHMDLMEARDIFNFVSDLEEKHTFKV